MVLFRRWGIHPPDLNLTLVFPDGWRTFNAPDFVGAQAKDEGAMVVMEIQGDGGDAMEAAREYAAAQKIQFPQGPEPVDLGGLPAAGASFAQRGPRGDAIFDFTWIIHEGTVYRLMGATVAQRAAAYRPAFREIAASLRPLTLSERQSIQVIRLRLVEARDGETLKSLMGRVAAVLDADATGVANGISVDTPLQGGQLVKVAAWELYRRSVRDPSRGSNLPSPISIDDRRSR